MKSAAASVGLPGCKIVGTPGAGMPRNTVSIK